MRGKEEKGGEYCIQKWARLSSRNKHQPTRRRGVGWDERPGIYVLHCSPEGKRYAQFHTRMKIKDNLLPQKITFRGMDWGRWGIQLRSADSSLDWPAVLPCTGETSNSFFVTAVVQLLYYQWYFCYPLLFRDFVTFLVAGVSSCSLLWSNTDKSREDSNGRGLLQTDPKLVDDLHILNTCLISCDSGFDPRWTSGQRRASSRHPLL